MTEPVELYEKLASIQHDIWASWQGYVHEQKLSKSLRISPSDYTRWQQQIAADYADLSEKEKDSDREQVEKFWHLILPLLDRIAELEAKLTQIQDIVNEQAEDEGLWFIHQYATEDYLQQALRRLHGVFEDE